MTGNNDNLIPKENYKKVEEVREINNEVPSFEEFMKTYREDKGVVDSYDLEVDSYSDIRVKGTYYGPGFWDDFLKPVASGALVVASIFPPTAAMAAPIALGVAGAGVVVTGIGHAADSEGWKEAGKNLIEIGSGAHEAQGALKTPDAPLNQYARSRNRK